MVIAAFLTSPLSTVALTQEAAPAVVPGVADTSHAADTHLTEESIVFAEETPHTEETPPAAPPSAREEEAPLPQETPAADTPLIEEELPIETLLLPDGESPDNNQPNTGEKPAPPANPDNTADTQGAPSGALILILKPSSDSHRHGTITAVTALPGSPSDGAVIRFTASASSLTNTVDTDGSTAKTTAAKNDMFRYRSTGTKWVFMGNGVTTAGISSDVDGITNDTTPTLIAKSSDGGNFSGAGDEGYLILKKDQGCAGLSKPSGEYLSITGAGWSQMFYGTSETNTYNTQIEAQTAGKKCFSAGFLAYDGQSTSNWSEFLELTIDTTAPTLAAFKAGTGNGATYIVTATDASPPLTGRTKDSIASGSCTDSTDTTVSGWSDYTPGEDTGAAHDTVGRCVIITDVAGNSKAQHLLDSASITVIPATPTGLTATWGTAGVTLSWTDPSDSNITGYEYQQCDSAGANCGSWTDIAGSTATTVTHPVTSLSANTEYTVKIRATYASTNSIAVSAVGTTGTIYDTDGDGLIEINTIQKLNAIRWDLDGDGTPATGQATNYNAVFPNAATHLGCPGPCDGYELTADLDLDDNTAGNRGDDTYDNSGAGWEPIGADSTNNRFTATFNGNGFVIDNLLINRSTTPIQALFGSTETGAIITAVGLRDVNVTGANGTAALVGASQAGTVIKTSFSTGTITGEWATGGLVGYNEGAVEASYSSATVYGSTAVGGLVGNNIHTTASIRNSYAIGAVTQSATTHLGGLVGNNQHSATIADSYWNTTITAAAGVGTTGANRATGKTTAQLTSPTGYASTAANSGTAIYNPWDDRNIDGISGNDAPWNFGSAGHYPALTFGGHRLSTQWPSAGNLSNLTTSAGTLTPVFDAYTYIYTAEVPATTASVTVTPTADTIGTAITVNGATVSSGAASAAITLTAGETTAIPVIVTPSSGTPHTYTLNVARLKDYDDDNDGLIDIRTHQQLNAVRWDLDGNGTPTSGKEGDYAAAFPHAADGMGCKLTDHDSNPGTPQQETCTGYELRADIDLDTNGNGHTWTGTEASPTGDSGDAYHNSGAGWAPIGHQPSAAFHTTFKGNGHTISNLFINRTATYTGLFGFTGRPSNSHTRIEGVGLKNAYVKGGGTTGALVGRNEKPVTASWVTGAVRGANGVGGLIGLNSGTTVTASYSLASVTATNTVGGLIGQQENGGIIASYAGGKVTASGSTKGGLVAAKSSTASATDTFYNSDTTTLSASALGTAKTDAELRTPTGYTGIYLSWNVDVGGTNASDDPWSIVAGNYPVLKHGTGADAAAQRTLQPAVPATPTLARHSPTVAVHTDKTPTFRVTSLTEGATITLHASGDCTGAALTTTPTTVTVGSSDTNKDIESTFVIGSHTVSAKQTKDNIPVCSSGVSFEIKGKPAAPANIAIALGDGEVTVSWDNPNDPTITKYQYQQKVDTGSYSAWADISPSGPSTFSKTFTGLTNGTAYTYKIRAVNAAGNGAESETSGATPVATISAAPASVTLASDTNDNITPYTTTTPHRTRDTTPTISFTAVANAVTTAKYRRGNSGNFTATGVTVTGTGATTARTVLLPALTHNDTYDVQITQTDGIKTAKTVVYSFVLDTVSPTVSAVVTTTGAATSGGVKYLGIGDKVIVTFTFNEDLASSGIAAKFINDGTTILSSGGRHLVTTAAASSPTLTLTVRAAGPDVASGDLSYQLISLAGNADFAGNRLAAQTAVDIPNIAIDITKPALTPTKVGTGAAATYKVAATDNSPITGRTKDNVASGSCIDTATTTDGDGWSDYTPGADTGTAHDTAGRCVIITDAAGNSKAQHLADSDLNIPPDFTLDITGDGSVGVYDAIAHYIYEVFKAQEPNGRQAMTPFLTGGDSAQIVWNRLQQSNNVRDFSGNGSTDQIDAIVHYIYEVFKDQEPNGRQAMTPFLTGAGARTGTAVFTLLNNFAGR